MITRKELIERIMQCPVCNAAMTESDDGKSALCLGPRRHCFDFSKDGYLSFPMSSGGDSKSAVNARTSFLGRGYYEPAAIAVKNALLKYVSKDATVIDAGCGEGYYTSMLARGVNGIMGFDLSKFACSAASKQARRDGIDNLMYATASVFELPVKDGAADAVVNIFAPCAETEYKRVLRDGGYLFVVGAGSEHLMGLKRAVYDNVYENGERADMPTDMQHIEKIIAKHEITVFGEADIAALFSMTPYYWRTSESDREKLIGLDKLETSVEFEINIYRK